MTQRYGDLCTRCGKCCTLPSYMLNLRATEADRDRWVREGRDDILRYYANGDLWVDSEKGGDPRLERCPFVRKDGDKPTYSCAIYETRPEVCRNYPRDEGQMEYAGCEILDILHGQCGTQTGKKPT